MTINSKTKAARDARTASIRRWASLVCFAGVAGLLTACGAPNQAASGEAGSSTTVDRSDPEAAFLEIAERALSDLDYVRVHLDPSLVDAAVAKDPTQSREQVIEGFRDELQRSRPYRWVAGSSDDSGTIHASGSRVGVFAGVVWQFKIDMRYDPALGWVISSPAYDHKRLGES